MVLIATMVACGGDEGASCPTDSPTHGGDCSGGQTCGDGEQCIDLGAGVKGCFHACQVGAANQCVEGEATGTCAASSVGIGYCMSWVCP